MAEFTVSSVGMGAGHLGLTRIDRVAFDLRAGGNSKECKSFGFGAVTRDGKSRSVACLSLPVPTVLDSSRKLSGACLRSSFLRNRMDLNKRRLRSITVVPSNNEEAHQSSDNNKEGMSDGTSSGLGDSKDELREELKKRVLSGRNAKDSDSDIAKGLLRDLEQGRKRLQEAAEKLRDPLRDMVSLASRKLQERLDKWAGNEHDTHQYHPTWEQWQSVFADVEEKENLLMSLKCELAEALEEEDYAAAAKMQLAIDYCVNADAIGSMVKEMKEALGNGQYDKAAVLRDEAGAGLVGWWAAGSEGGGETHGRIVCITPSYGRLIARSYTSKQLSTATEGTVIFEVFVRKAGDGSYQLQPVYLQRDPVLDGRIGAEQLAKQTSISENGVRGEGDRRGITGGGAGGLVVPKVDVGTPMAPSSSSAASAEEDGEFDPEGFDRVIKYLNDRLPNLKLKVFRVTTATSDMDVQDIVDRVLRPDSNETGGPAAPGEVKPLTADAEAEPGRAAAANEGQSGSSEPSTSGSSAGAGGSGGAGVSRDEGWKSGRKRQFWGDRDPGVNGGLPGLKGLGGFWLGLGGLAGGTPGLGGAGGGERSGPGAGANWGSRQGANPSSVRVVVGGVLQNGSEERVGKEPVRVPARIEPRDRNSFALHIPPVRNIDWREGREVAAANLAKWQVPVASSADGTPGVGTKDEARGKLQAEKEKLPDKITQEVSEMVRQAISQAQRRRGLAPITGFRRLDTEAINGDTFSGLYVGAFGPYTSEVLQLRRRVGKFPVEKSTSSGGALGGLGDAASSSEPRLKGPFDEPADFCEYVEAVKLTGDLNLPTSHVTFRAKIGKQHELPHHRIFPAQLGVRARYKGQGKLSDAGGGKNSRWIDGELLVFDGQSGGPTHDAELGFLYSVPERMFLVLFTRLKLQSVDPWKIV